MSKPFLSIGIASYNYSQYLDKAFEQIKKQNFKDIEILYCDDGSTDDSVEKIKKIISSEPELTIRLLQGEHGGILANRNRIIENASGEYLMLCDADDFMLDGCLDMLCSVAKKENADCVIGGFVEVSDKGTVLKQHVPNSNSSKWLYTWHHGQIYKLDIVRQNNIKFEQIPDDVFYLQRIHANSNKVSFVQQPVYAWCRHSSSTSIDYEQNPDWHPVHLWEKISVFISELRNNMQADDDKRNLDYYLYKWYYFNVSDLNKENAKRIRQDMKLMRESMDTAKPDYRKIKSLNKAMQAGDTTFARVAVAICWLLEKMHLLILVVLARKFQGWLRK